jgi:predicted amidohydrolase
MRVAAIQYKPPKGRPELARRELADLISSAGRQGARVVVCPEMAVLGYVWPSLASVLHLAEPASGPTFQVVSALARQFSMWVTVGFAERDGTRLYNSALVVGPTGELVTVYRKVLLFDLDRTWASAGDKRVILNVDGLRVAIGICMDLNDEGFRHFLGHERPDQLWFLTNWLEEGMDVVGYWRRRTAPWTGALVAANTWGDDGAVGFSGRSLIWESPHRIVGRAGRDGQTVVVADLNVQLASETGSRLAVG